MQIDQTKENRSTRHSLPGSGLSQIQQRIIQQLGDYFKTSKVKKAYLFGSFAREEQTSQSDIDVLIEFDDSKLPTLLDLIEVKMDLEDLLQRSVDIVQKGTEYSHISETLHRDKILVYG